MANEFTNLTIINLFSFLFFLRVRSSNSNEFGPLFKALKYRLQNRKTFELCIKYEIRSRIWILSQIYDFSDLLKLFFWSLCLSANVYCSYTLFGPLSFFTSIIKNRCSVQQTVHI